jgi:hypothetical protein
MQSAAARILGISVLVLAAALFMNRPGPQGADNGKPRPTFAPPADPVPPTDTNKQAGSTSRWPTRTASRDLRGQQLAQLKERWLGMKDQAPGSTIVDDLIARDQLSKESARLLMCSPEAIQLIQFLETEGIQNTVRSKIEKLFDSDLAEEARQTLVSLPDEASGDGTHYRQEWAGDAGKGCPPEKFDGFCSALGSASSVQAALFGHNIALAKTDPIGALTSTVNQISAGLASANMNSSVDNLLEELPPGTDFEQIDKILAAQPETPGSPFVGIRTDFVRAWSNVDPASTVNYLIANADRFPVSDIQIPAGQMLEKDLTRGIEWIQTFPEGPHFDAAVDLAVSLLIDRGNPKEAQQLASQIGNSELREANMRAAAAPPKRYSESE